MDTKQLAEKFKGVFELMAGERGTTTELVDQTGLSFSSVWNYMNQLQVAGWVKKYKSQSSKKVIWAWVDKESFNKPTRTEPEPPKTDAEILPEEKREKPQPLME